jgi:hypothetical protein
MGFFNKHKKHEGSDKELERVHVRLDRVEARVAAIEAKVSVQTRGKSDAGNA